MPRGTTLRNVRVSDDLWQRARIAAEEQGETVSQVVRWALEAYVEAWERPGAHRNE